MDAGHALYDSLHCLLMKRFRGIGYTVAETGLLLLIRERFARKPRCDIDSTKERPPVTDYADVPCVLTFSAAPSVAALTCLYITIPLYLVTFLIMMTKMYFYYLIQCTVKKNPDPYCS
jgi:hypothetical protein